MHWRFVPAVIASAVMAVWGIGALIRPRSLESFVGVRAETPLGTSEIRAVFGGMFIAWGVAAIVLLEPIVFAVLGAAWLADLAVRIVAVFADRVPAKQALSVLGIALAMGVSFLSGYWLA